MANKTVKLLTNAADFPLTYANATRTAILNDDAAPRMPGNFYGDSANADYGTPQLIYAENVMPCAKGIFSVGFSQQAAEHATATSFDRCIPLRDPEERVFPFSPAGGENYVLDPVSLEWSSVSPVTPSGRLVTYAYVEGRTFICYEQTKIIEYNASTGLFEDVVLTLPAGYTMSNIRGIGGAANYLLLFTTLSILWCAPLNLTEFANVDMGAGEQTPIDIKANIVALLPVAGGFIVYTARNAIGASFTNDAGSPFLFQEIPNCGGVADIEKITVDAEAQGHYLYGTHGLQRVTLQASVQNFPEVTDFLTGRQIERWNPLTKTVDLTALSSDFAVKLAFVLGRYLAISYGEVEGYYEFVLVYDTALKRWGKLQCEHCDVFSYPYPSGTGDYTYETIPTSYGALTISYDEMDIFYLEANPPKDGFALLTRTGEIVIAKLDFTQAVADGVALFGHLQLRHDRHTTLLDVEIDGLRNEGELTVIASEDGYTKISSDVIAPETQASGYSHYSCRETAKSFDIAIEGTFVLSSLLATVMFHGSR
jgi:hypothetical protein